MLVGFLLFFPSRPELEDAVLTTADSIPFVCTISSLAPDTRYFYRMRYRPVGSSTYLVRSSHTFHTARSRGSTFTFAVEADPHMDSNSIPAVYPVTLQNILARRPDFLVDLGDTFMSEKLAVITPTAIRDRHLLLRSYFDIATHSVPLFLALGNHEGELGWRLDSTANNLPVWASKARTTYFPNPLPDTVRHLVPSASCMLIVLFAPATEALSEESLVIHSDRRIQSRHASVIERGRDSLCRLSPARLRS